MRKEFNEEWDAQRDLIFGKEKAAELRKRQERRETAQLIEEIHEWVARHKRIMKRLLLPCQITIYAIFYALFLWTLS